MGIYLLGKWNICVLTFYWLPPDEHSFLFWFIHSWHHTRRSFVSKLHYYYMLCTAEKNLHIVIQCTAALSVPQHQQKLVSLLMMLMMMLPKMYHLLSNKRFSITSAQCSTFSQEISPIFPSHVYLGEFSSIYENT